MADKIACALGAFQNYAKQSGNVVDETELVKEIKDPHSQASYADGSNKYQESLGEGLKDKLWEKGMQFGSDRKDLITKVAHYIQRADAVLGRPITDAVEKIYQEHLAMLKEKGLTTEGTDYLWKDISKPKLSELYYKSFNEFSKTDKSKVDYLHNYFANHLEGGRLYGSRGATSIIGRLTQNLLRNFISWNPALVAYHGLEATPKLMAYAIEHGGSPLDVISAIADHMKANKGNFFAQAKDMADKGIYGFEEHGPGIAGSGLHKLVDVSENPLRGVAYRLGERLGTGGTHAVENIAFVYRYGNEPLLAMTSTGMNDFGMMRYTLGQAQFLLHLASQPTNPRAMAALAAFSAVNALQTGFKSVIPLPAQAVMPQDWKDKIKELDDAIPALNIVKKMTGSDFSERTAPLAFPSVGVPLAMANEAVKSTGRAFKQASTEAQEGNATAAAARIVQGLWGIGQLDSIKGVNIITNKAVQALADQLAGQNDNPDFIQGAGEDFLKKTKLYQEPK